MRRYSEKWLTGIKLPLEKIKILKIEKDVVDELQYDG